eukprot:7148245-Pyramimonas_sp.AAC.1
MANSGAVEIIAPREAGVIRRERPDRIITSRMVRRWKPVEGAFSEPTAKSRRCVHGHKDPDTGTLYVCSPTPQTSSILVFIQVMMNLGHLGDIADVENAFCQSDPMSRVQGEIYVGPCEGIKVEKGSLIRLLANVY